MNGKQVVVQLNGNAAGVLRELAKAEAAAEKLGKSMDDTGKHGSKAGKEIADAMKRAARQATGGINGLLLELRQAGGENAKLAKAMEAELRDAALHASGGVSQIKDEIIKVRPELAETAKRMEAEFAEASRKAAGSFARPLDELEKLGPEAARVADKIRSELKAAGRVGEAALNDMLSPLDHADVRVKRVSQSLMTEAKLAADTGESAFQRFGSSAVTQLTAVAGSYIGVQEAIQGVTAAIENQIRVTEDARAANMTLAEAQASARKNLNVSSLDAGQRKFLLDDFVQNVSAEFSNDDLASIAKAVGDSVSSGADFKQTKGAVRTAAALSILSPDEIDETASAIVKVQSATGIADPESVASKVLAAGSMSQVIDPAKLFRNLPPAMQGGRQVSQEGFGMQGALESAALFAALSKAGGDDQGDSTATAVIQLNNKTREFFAEIGKETESAKAKLAELSATDPLTATQRSTLQQLLSNRASKPQVDAETEQLRGVIAEIQNKQDAGGLPPGARHELSVQKRKANERLSVLSAQRFDEFDAARLKTLEATVAEAKQDFAAEQERLRATIAAGQVNGRDIAAMDPGSPLSRIQFIQKNGLAGSFAESAGSFGEQRFKAGIENLLEGGEVAGVAAETNTMLQSSQGGKSLFAETVQSFRDTTNQLSVAIANKGFKAADVRQDASDSLAAIDATVRSTVIDALADTRRDYGINDGLFEQGLKWGVGLKGAAGAEEAVSGAMALEARRGLIAGDGVTPEEAPKVRRLESDVSTLVGDILGGSAVRQSSNLRSAAEMARGYAAAGREFDGSQGSMERVIRKYGVNNQDVIAAHQNPQLMERMISVLEKQLELQQQMLDEQRVTSESTAATAEATAETAENSTRRPDPADAQAAANAARNQ